MAGEGYRRTQRTIDSGGSSPDRGSSLTPLSLFEVCVCVVYGTVLRINNPFTCRFCMMIDAGSSQW